MDMWSPLSAPAAAAVSTSIDDSTDECLDGCTDVIYQFIAVLSARCVSTPWFAALLQVNPLFGGP